MTDDKAIHFAFYASDWLAGTRGLTPAETGVYITLVAMMYERQGPLPNDNARLARMCNCPAGTFRKIIAVLLDEGKLTVTSDGLWNGRVEREIESAKSAMKAASDRGKRAANSRWSAAKHQSDECENATVKPQSDKQQRRGHEAKLSNEISENPMHAQCASNANQNQSQNIGTDVPITRAKTRSVDPPGFQKFWDAYPHRGGVKRNRKGAEAKFSAALKRGVTVDQIMAGVSAMQSDPAVQRGFARDPVTWINQDGWTDEHDPQPFCAAGSAVSARQASTSDAYRRILDAAARARAPSPDDIPFG